MNMRSRMKVGVFWSGILPLFLWTFVSGQPSCPIETNRTELQTPYEIPTKLTFNSAFMSPIVHSFLGSVQPNPFPKDLLIRMINDKNFSMERVKEVLKYEIGFLVCVAIGILYIVLMPLIGLIFACCRCCGNCGGRMQQKQTTNIHCKRRSFYLATFLITVLILAGNVCMFLSSTNTSETVMRSPTELTDVLENVKGYLNTISKQIEQVKSESNVTVDTVKSNLNGSLLGKLIQNGLKGPLDPAFNSITEIAQVINSTSHELLKLNKTLELLKPKVDVLKANLSAVRQRINNTLHMPDCVNCTSQRPELDKLSLEGSLDFPDQNDLRSAVDKAINADVIGQANKGRDFFDSIPATVKNESRLSVQVALLQLETLKTKISGVTKDLPLDVLKTISAPLTDVQKSIKAFSPDIERSSQISRAVGLVLSCLILLVVICNFLGLLLGVAGLNPKDNPIERSGTSNCGGIFFMAGVGFSFLVSWIFMLVVLILFIVGGNTYTLVCKPWQNKELIQLIDTPGLIPGFNLSRALNLNTNLNIVNVYSDCQKNKPLWTTFHLNEIFDLNSKLDVSQYTHEIDQTFDGVQINIANITILSPEVKSQLNNFNSSASSMNFSNITQQINDVSGINLSSIAESLDILAGKQSNQAIKDELHGEAKDLRDIQTDITSNIMPLLLELNTTVKNLSVVASQITAAVKNVFQKVDYAQEVLNFKISQIVKTESRAFIDCQLKIFQTFLHWANQTITERVGRCGPAAAAVDRSEELVCKHLVESLNAFWLSLGWCMMFLIPSIIFSVKLAKYYRRMKYSDVYENNNFMMNPFPKAHLKPELLENGKQPPFT
ncbi:prominin-1-A-like [Sinocyclocheilus rhinocerous]|uniref:prominin-1-A-like n=1 Tax=Sinocyclocheilus rhinocerous TaxID=307959 RepID=UPI0007BA4A9C|nr:PREDICTED: prominin-1-A-like [Sinocyclocheilus rhinocerous]